MINGITKNGIRWIEADEGKILTNGDTTTKKAYLGNTADASLWSEIDEPVPDDITEAEYNSAKQTVTDYEAQNKTND